MKQEPFSSRFPYEVQTRADVIPADAEEWLRERFYPENREGRLTVRTWITKRDIGFADPKHAMEFKLRFG